MLFFFFSFLLVLLTHGVFAQQKTTSCSRKRLNVKPSNRSHLVLSDLITLKQHYEKECENGTVVIDKLLAIVQAVHYESDKKFELDVDDSGKAYIPINPCFACEIFVKAIDQNGTKTKITTNFHYNERSNDRYPYNNVFKNEAIEKICLRRKDKIKIPTPPASIKSCVFIQDEQPFLGESGNSQTQSSGNITFAMVDPATEKNPRNICIQAYMDEIKDCSKTRAKTEYTIAKLPFSEVDMSTCLGFNINDEKNDTTNALVIGLSVVVGLLLVALVASLIHKRRKDVKQREDSAARGEVNPMYGDYYGGGTERERTMEILNQNSVYGTKVEWGDGGTVKDNNPYYDTTA